MGITPELVSYPTQSNELIAVNCFSCCGQSTSSANEMRTTTLSINARAPFQGIGRYTDPCVEYVRELTIVCERS